MIAELEFLLEEQRSENKMLKAQLQQTLMSEEEEMLISDPEQQQSYSSCDDEEDEESIPGCLLACSPPETVEEEEEDSVPGYFPACRRGKKRGLRLSLLKKARQVVAVTEKMIKASVLCVAIHGNIPSTSLARKDKTLLSTFCMLFEGALKKDKQF
ncbi:uncharacterized protein [Branchiostoma lanceolatum]|uniref:uncharacterized protein n=1 Tax=Branchiostoma lanceolatum TaxID=7740 RepID=UPI003451B41A